MNGMLRRIIQLIDIYWLALDGYITDFEQLDYVYSERRPFSKSGMIKDSLSMFPWRDRLLKRIANQYGGWERIMSPDYEVTEKIYADLERAGFSRESYNLSRKYLADPKEYRTRALRR
jgi:hypothetical protein